MDYNQLLANNEIMYTDPNDLKIQVKNFMIQETLNVNLII